MPSGGMEIPISTAGFGTSMSAHRILGLKLVPRVGLFAH